METYFVMNICPPPQRFLFNNNNNNNNNNKNNNNNNNNNNTCFTVKLKIAHCVHIDVLRGYISK